MSRLQSILAIRDLAVRRNGFPILQGISWTVARGQHWVILGPNGSGKTSLLQALTAYLTPSEGEIEVLGRTYGDYPWPELRKHIGLVSGALAQRIEEGTTALEVVSSGHDAQINPWGRTPPGARRRALGLMRRLHCAFPGNRPWGQLSQGERQRCLIARALMPHPALLILDEPCSGLDPVARERFLETIDHLTRLRRGPALLLVTHHLEEITSGFTHGLLLSHGTLAAAGPLQQVMTGPLLQRIFEAPLKLRRQAGKFEMHLKRIQAKK